MIGMLLDSADSISLTNLKSLSNLAESLEETMEVALSKFTFDFKADKLVLTRNAAHLMRKYPLSCFDIRAHLQSEYPKSDKSSQPSR
jgi:hypothetical protein